MALTLKEAITATQTTIDVNGTDTLTNGDMYSLDDEYVLINTADLRTIQPGETAYQRVSLDRGVLGTRKAAHAAAATLTAVNIASGGGGGLTNPVLEPFAVSPAEAVADTPSLTIVAVDPAAYIVSVTGAEDQASPAIIYQSSTDESLFTVGLDGRVAITPPDDVAGVEPLKVTAPSVNEEALAVFLVDTDPVVTIGGSDTMNKPVLRVAGVAGSGQNILHVVNSSGQTAMFMYDNGDLSLGHALHGVGFYGTEPIPQPELPATPTEQDIADVLVALGLVTQAAP